jgi:drug/metabolite transporter (DMT)-like permease
LAWVLADRQRSAAFPARGKTRVAGILLALGGATGQALGLVCAKQGMRPDVAGGEPLDPLTATLVRMIAAAVAIWLIAGLRGSAGAALRSTRDWRAMCAASLGTLLAPFAGVWLSLVSVALTETGIGATMMATGPIILLPLVRLIYGERIGWSAILGTVVAFAGVAVLFLGGK